MQSGEAEGDKRAQQNTRPHQYGTSTLCPRTHPHHTQPFRAQVLEALKQRGYCSRLAKSGIGTSSKNTLIRLICVFPLCSGVSSTFGRRCFQTGLAPLHPLRLFAGFSWGSPCFIRVANGLIRLICPSLRTAKSLFAPWLRLFVACSVSPVSPCSSTSNAIGLRTVPAH